MKNVREKKYFYVHGKLRYFCAAVPVYLNFSLLLFNFSFLPLLVNVVDHNTSTTYFQCAVAMYVCRYVRKFISGAP